MLGLAADDRGAYRFRRHAPWRRRCEAGRSGLPADLPAWIERELSPHVTPDEWPALLDRAPLDLRVNVARTVARRHGSAFGAEPTRLSPWGLRLPPDTRVDDRPEYAEGLVEVQDEGSQLIALACGRRPGW